MDDWQNLESFRFGDSDAMADRLAALVVAAVKTATCWSVADGQQTHVGKRMVVRDGGDRSVAVIETLRLEQVRFDEVNWDFAAAEGEGDRDLAEWRDGHQAYFERHDQFAPDMLLWCERFRVIERL